MLQGKLKGKKAVVIGAGFGGLAIANRLLSQGAEVTVLEKQPMAGGQAMQIKKKGYTFDLGPSLITAPEIVGSIFEQAGSKLSDYIEIEPIDPFYRIYFHDKTFLDYTGDSKKMKQQIAKFSNKDAGNYDRFMRYAKRMHKAVIVDRLGAMPFDNLRALLGFLPRALWLGALLPCVFVVKRFFKHPNILFAFSFHPLFIGGNPFRSPAVFLMIPYLEKIGGVLFSKGGMYSLVSAFVKLFKDRGGKLETSSEVQEILIENGKAVGVRTAAGELKADIVVSNGHFAHTYKDLIPSSKRKLWTDRRVKRKSYSMSSFLLYIGTKKQYPQLLHHTLILSKRYKDLIKDIFDNKILADDFSMYLHVPTRSDSGMAPEGCESMYLLIPVPNLAADIDWKSEAPKFTEKILKFMEEDFGLEGLRENIEVLETFTPEDFQSQRNNYLGAAWSLEPSLLQIANFRPHNRSEEFKNLYLVGASAHPGGGVPGVLLSAETTEKVILADHAVR
jgi:phytoene desaturase